MSCHKKLKSFEKSIEICNYVELEQRITNKQVYIFVILYVFSGSSSIFFYKSSHIY